jgi:hypothetical protein
MDCWDNGNSVFIVKFNASGDDILSGITEAAMIGLLGKCTFVPHIFNFLFYLSKDNLANSFNGTLRYISSTWNIKHFLKVGLASIYRAFKYGEFSSFTNEGADG